MEQEKAIIFAGEAHKRFYEMQLANCKKQDRWHKALIYALGLTEDIRNHFDEVYDFEDDSINRDSLESGWVTGMDARAMRLAFMLFTDYVPKDEAEKYFLCNLLDYDLTVFLWLAIRLRFVD